MRCLPTPHAVKLCVENSIRLFKDACSPDVSLPTTAALIEIGLEEMAKAILLLMSLLTEGDNFQKVLSKYFEITGNSESEEIFNAFKESMISSHTEHFFLEDKLEQDLKMAFKKHSIKTDLIKMFGIAFKSSNVGKILSSALDLQKEQYDVMSNLVIEAEEQFLKN